MLEHIERKMPGTSLIRFSMVLPMVLVIGIVFISFHNYSLYNGFPIAYSGDAYFVLGHIKAVDEGEFYLGLPKNASRLNAPEEAWWSDFPLTDLVYWLPGLFVCGDNLFQVANASVLVALISAAIAFYFCAIAMGSSPIYAAVLGVLFGLSPYGFVRNLEHLMLTWYFTVPIGIYLVWSIWMRPCPNRNCGIIFCILAFVCGLFNPYYVAMFLVLLGTVGIGTVWTKDWRRILWILAVVSSTVIGFSIQNMDTFLLQWKEGINSESVSRDLWWMIKFGLYLPDLILPKFHSSELINYIAGKNYHFKIPSQIAGEAQTAYVGIVAAISLSLLVFSGFARLFSGCDKRSNPFFLLALVVFLFSVVGGFNYLLGAFGFQLLRGSNRYSIFLMAIALFAFAEFLTINFKKSSQIAFSSILILLVGIYDQIPKVPEWQINMRNESQRRFLKDREFFPPLEAVFPSGSMIFQLPVHQYPEMGSINLMGDYEHIRPYLHTNSLRFSYGASKGRVHGEWQLELDFEISLHDALFTLKEKGFSAILLNRRAYSDGGAEMLSKLKSEQLELLKQNTDFFLFSIPNMDSAF